MFIGYTNTKISSNNKLLSDNKPLLFGEENLLLCFLKNRAKTPHPFCKVFVM